MIEIDGCRENEIAINMTLNLLWSTFLPFQSVSDRKLSTIIWKVLLEHDWGTLRGIPRDGQSWRTMGSTCPCKYDWGTCCSSWPIRSAWLRPLWCRSRNTRRPRRPGRCTGHFRKKRLHSGPGTKRKLNFGREGIFYTIKSLEDRQTVIL